MKDKFQLLIHRFFHWEYWPMGMVYYPLFPVWLFYALKARSFFFFNASNPGIEYGGLVMESKMKIYERMPKDVYPKTLLVRKSEPSSPLLNEFLSCGLNYPLIAKPDIGMKALGVEKIENWEQLARYTLASPSDFLLQELIAFPEEIGVFYCRMPGEEKGKITGIVHKEFLRVTGDGSSTLLQLIRNHRRAHFQIESLKKTWSNSLNTVPKKGQSIELVPFGSHTRGARFTDITHEINDGILQVIDSICKNVEGFYFGRLDVKCTSLKDLSEGKNFSIIEINGAGSEPTHMYDPTHSIFFAWKEIVRHWSMMYKISSANRELGHTYLGFNHGRQLLKRGRLLEAQLRSMH